MDQHQLLDGLKKAMIALDPEQVVSKTEQSLELGISPLEVIQMDLLRPKIQEQGVGVEKKGTVVIGTVKGDQHYIGKDIVKLLMETAGFEVHDLGVDVDPFAFIVKADEVNADIIALSALLTTTLVGQKDIIEALEGQGKRDKFKVIVGGGAVTQSWSEEIGADGYAENAYGAVGLARSFVE